MSLFFSRGKYVFSEIITLPENSDGFWTKLYISYFISFKFETDDKLLF